MISREVQLKQRPVGMPTPEDFDLVEAPVPEPADGEVPEAADEEVPEAADEAGTTADEAPEPGENA